MSVWSQLEITRVVPAVEGTVVYRLAGAFTDSKEGYALLDKVRADLDGGAARVVVNLAEVPRMTSGGIGILAACFTSARDAGGSLALVGVDDRNRTLLQAVGLWDRLDTFATEADAGLA